MTTDEFKNKYDEEEKKRAKLLDMQLEDFEFVSIRKRMAAEREDWRWERELEMAQLQDERNARIDGEDGRKAGELEHQRINSSIRYNTAIANDVEGLPEYRQELIYLWKQANQIEAAKADALDRIADALASK